MSAMSALLSIVRTKPHTFKGCHQPTAAERMARYSQRHAVEMQERENAGVAPPRARVVDGRLVLLALDGNSNPLPKDRT